MLTIRFKSRIDNYDSLDCYVIQEFYKVPPNPSSDVQITRLIPKTLTRIMVASPCIF